MGRDAGQIGLNELQRLIRGAVVAILRRHHRDQPITLDQIRENINTWLAIFHPSQFADGKAKRRDVEKVIQHCRTSLRRCDREPICSNGDGMFWATTPDDYDSYISQLESRLRWISRNLRCARQNQRDMMLGKDTSAPIEMDIFDQQVDVLLDQSGRACGNLLTIPPPGATPGGGDENLLPKGRRERIDG